MHYEVLLFCSNCSCPKRQQQLQGQKIVAPTMLKPLGCYVQLVQALHCNEIKLTDCPVLKGLLLTVSMGLLLFCTMAWKRLYTS